MNVRFSTWCVGIVLAASAAAAGESDPARGAEVLAPFKQQLQRALREGLAEGPVEAIAACPVRAPEIASSLSRDGLRLGRTSDRLRNPANSPPDWVRPILDEYAASPSERAPRAVPLPDGRSGYVEPILVQPLCLTCHGETLAPEVEARLAERYPTDRAIGYRVGDLRGVFWAELPPAE